VLLISPVLGAQDRPDADALLYHQIVRGAGIGIGLVTDPHGADFKPYLNELLGALKAHGNQLWLDSPGIADPRRIVIEATIAQNGTVVKLTAISPSLKSMNDTLGVDRALLATLRASFAAIKASSPFPAFSKEINLNQIVVQFNFTAN